jgi:Na+-driven multidrug efflux pump
LVQAAVAIFNILINFWIIPAHGWRGAAWSSIASDALLALGLAVVARYLVARAPTHCAPAEGATVGYVIHAHNS